MGFMLDIYVLTLEPTITLPKIITCSLSCKKRKICDISMGEYVFASDVGSVAVCLPITNYIYFISPLYWVPGNITIMLSPGYMKLSSSFKITVIEPLEYCGFICHSRNKFSCATTVKSNLDYLKLKVIKTTQVLVSKHTR